MACVEAVLPAVELCHVIPAGLVGEGVIVLSAFLATVVAGRFAREID